MTALAVTNIGDSHSGALDGTQLDGDALVCRDGTIEWIGSSADAREFEVDVVVDAAGAAVVPGFIDSHVHVTFGDYTPRQQTVGFLESYLHGGTTTAISASEVHVPGRPTDVVGVMSLAIAAQRAFTSFRPGGVRVHAGSVILEPGLEAVHFAQLREAGVWLAKAGFGAVATAHDYVALVQAAKEAGLVVMCHTGGASIGGSLERIDADALLAMAPHVSGHTNGGPTALSPAEHERLVREGGDMCLQVVDAGNLKAALHICELALEASQAHRILIATDTPTGSGVIPLGMLRCMTHLVSLGALTPQLAIAAATGNVGRAYGIDAGLLEVGRPADLLIVDAPLGSYATGWDQAMELGDVLSIPVAITAGEVRFTRSRNTPPPQRGVHVL
jgi:enamidase